MTEEDNIKAELMHKRMLNQFGINELANIGIYKKLILALSESDLQELTQKNVFFNPIFSPATQNDIAIAIPVGSKIITLDINTLKLFSSDEGTAIVLHEIGHAVNPSKKGQEGEFVADDYAVNRNYKDAVISSLEKGKSIRPTEFSKQITETRIQRLKEMKSA